HHHSTLFPYTTLFRSSGEFGMYVGGRWYRLAIRPDLIPDTDPIGRLPITLLTRNIIEPLFHLTDPRTDKRIDFIGGGRGLVELEDRKSTRLNSSHVKI